jgi:hypothetical protein
MTFPKKKNILCIYCSKSAKRHFFWMDFQLLNGLDLVYVYHYHSPQKKSLQNSTHNFNFEIYLQFFILHDVFFSTQIYFICSFKINYFKSKANAIILKWAKIIQDMMSIVKKRKIK